MLSQTELKSQLSYCADTGNFTWLVPKKGQSRKEAGYTRKDGYVKIVINQKRYLAHRLAWLYMYGEPPQCIDHINCNPSDNRLCNLREATISQNGFNRPRQANNTSGYKGVYWNKGRSMWMARIYVKGKMVYLGVYKEIKEAAKAYKKASDELHGIFINKDGILSE